MNIFVFIQQLQVIFEALFTSPKYSGIVFDVVWFISSRKVPEQIVNDREKHFGGVSFQT